jgi:hypothetical protein
MGMRRTVALALMMVFSWMLMAPLLAPDGEANLPVCCRRHGKHHCAMSRMGRLDGQSRGFTTVSEKCPCLPASTCAVQSSSWQPEDGKPFCGEVSVPAACAAQTEARPRISFLRSHQRRGPPTPLA